LRQFTTAEAFGEDQGCYIVSTNDPEAMTRFIGTYSFIAGERIGTTGGDVVEGPGFRASLDDLRAAHEGFFPRLMGSELTPEF